MSTPPEKRQKTSSTSTEVIDVVQQPQGDLVLKVEKDKQSVLLRVHSILLKIGSPVFSTMLGPNFAEGSQQYTTDNPLCLEDDPESMKLLCLLLHHQPVEQSSLAWIPGVAVISDKYQCSTSIRPVLSSLITPLLDQNFEKSKITWGGKGLSLGNAMAIAYVVGDAQMFWRTTRSLLASVNADYITSSVNGTLQELLPDGVIGRLRQSQTRQRLELHSEVNKVAWTILRKQGGPCDKGIRLAGWLQYYWMGAVERSERWDAPKPTIEGDWTAISDIADRLENSHLDCGSSKSCNKCAPGLSNTLRSLVREDWDDLLGLCLECEQTLSRQEAGTQCNHTFSK